MGQPLFDDEATGRSSRLRRCRGAPGRGSAHDPALPIPAQRGEREKTPAADAFRLPAGRLFAGLGIAFCCVLLSRMGLPELVVILATAVLATASWLWARRRAG